MNSISKLRKGLGMSQAQFAKALHVTCACNALAEVDPLAVFFTCSGDE